MDSKEQAGGVWSPGRMWFESGKVSAKKNWPDSTPEEWADTTESDRAFMEDAAKGLLDLARPAPAERPREAATSPRNPGDTAGPAGLLEIAIDIEQEIREHDLHPLLKGRMEIWAKALRDRAAQGAAGGRECLVMFNQFGGMIGNPIPAFWARPTPPANCEWVRMAEVVEPPPALPREALEVVASPAIMGALRNLLAKCKVARDAGDQETLEESFGEIDEAMDEAEEALEAAEDEAYELVKSWQGPLWDAINTYMRACGGHNTKGGVQRMDAVARFNRALECLLTDARATLKGESHGK